MPHTAHEMHENSLEAYQQEAGKLGERAKRILSVFRHAHGPLTARDVLDIINSEDGSDHQDMNHVRPRITELKKAGHISELQQTKGKDRKSGKTVALFKYVPRIKQLSFL